MRNALARSATVFLTAGTSVVLAAASCGGSAGIGIGDGGAGSSGGSGTSGGTSGGPGAPTNPTTCPSTTPKNGAACSPEGLRCDYGTCGAAVASCTGGAWAVGYTNGCVDPGEAAAPFACGSVTCKGTQYCVEPCCGGAGPQCEKVQSDGTCPGGTHPGTCSDGQPGCLTDPCVPPPPYCVDDPSTPQAQGCRGDKGSRVLSCACG